MSRRLLFNPMQLTELHVLPIRHRVLSTQRLIWSTAKIQASISTSLTTRKELPTIITLPCTRSRQQGRRYKRASTRMPISSHRDSSLRCTEELPVHQRRRTHCTSTVHPVRVVRRLALESKEAQRWDSLVKRHRLFSTGLSRCVVSHHSHSTSASMLTFRTTQRTQGKQTRWDQLHRSLKMLASLQSQVRRNKCRHDQRKISWTRLHSSNRCKPWVLLVLTASRWACSSPLKEDQMGLEQSETTVLLLISMSTKTRLQMVRN